MEQGGSLSQVLAREILGVAPRKLVKIEAELLFVEGQYLFHWQDQNGEERFKFLAAQSLRQAFTQVEVDSGWLPSGICRFGTTARGEWLVGFMPPGLQQIQLPGLLQGQASGVEGQGLAGAEAAVSSFSVPLPGLVFAGVGRSYFVWAVRDRVLTPQSQLFHAPLPNLYQDGLVCFGDNQPSLLTAKSFAEAWELFIASPFNSHLTNAKSRLYPGDVRRQLVALARKRRKKYPLSDLIPLPFYQYGGQTPLTLTQAIDRHILKKSV